MRLKLTIKIYQKGEYFQKYCQEINIKNIFRNFKILLLSHKFPIYHKLLIYGIALINFKTDVTWRLRDYAIYYNTSQEPTIISSSDIVSLFQPKILKVIDYTGKPLNSGHLWVLKNVSVIKRCPLLGGSLTKIVTCRTKHFVFYWKHVRYLGCPLLGGFTVLGMLINYAPRLFISTFLKQRLQLSIKPIL